MNARSKISHSVSKNDSCYYVEVSRVTLISIKLMGFISWDLQIYKAHSFTYTDYQLCVLLFLLLVVSAKMDIVKRDNEPMEWSTVPYNAPQGPVSNGKQRTSSLEAPIMLLSGHQSAIYTMKFNPAGTVIASGSHDREIFLWRVHGDCKNFADCVSQSWQNR